MYFKIFGLWPGSIGNDFRSRRDIAKKTNVSFKPIMICDIIRKRWGNSGDPKTLKRLLMKTPKTKIKKTTVMMLFRSKMARTRRKKRNVVVVTEATNSPPTISARRPQSVEVINLASLSCVSTLSFLGVNRAYFDWLHRVPVQRAWPAFQHYQ